MRTAANKARARPGRDDGINWNTFSENREWLNCAHARQPVMRRLALACGS
jgi:hypothetical protein